MSRLSRFRHAPWMLAGHQLLCRWVLLLNPADQEVTEYKIEVTSQKKEASEFLWNIYHGIL